MERGASLELPEINEFLKIGIHSKEVKGIYHWPIRERSIRAKARGSEAFKSALRV